MGKLTKSMGRLDSSFKGLGGGGASAIIDPYAGYLLFDSLTDSNDVAIADHTPEKGGPWVANSGTWTIQNNQLRESTGGSKTTVIDVEQADVIFQATWSVLAASDAGIVARYVDASNYLILVVDSITNFMILWKQVSGSWSQADSAAVVFAANDVIKLTASGTTITGFVNGTQKVQATVTDHATATKYGFFSNAAAYNSIRWDDVTVVAT